MENDNSLKDRLKDQAEYWMEVNGGISDIDVLLNTPSIGWAEKCIQAILQTGYELNNDPSDDDIDRCMNQLRRLIESHWLSLDRKMNILDILRGQWDRVPKELSDLIEVVFGEDIRRIMNYSVSDKDLVTVMMRSNPEMLKRILTTCKRRWFRYHYVQLYKRSEFVRTRVPGICRGECPELFDFISSALNMTFETKQLVMIEDVLDIENKENPRARSHKGLVNNIVCNQKEQYIPGCFRNGPKKISIDNKKEHKTPDWTFADESGAVIGTVECFAGQKDSIGELVKEAVKHGDSKELGENHYKKRCELPADHIRIASCVWDVYQSFPDDMPCYKEEVIRAIPRNTKMDGLFLVSRTPGSEQVIPIYFNISHRDVMQYLADEVKHCFVPKVVLSEKMSKSCKDDSSNILIAPRAS